MIVTAQSLYSWGLQPIPLTNDKRPMLTSWKHLMTQREHPNLHTYATAIGVVLGVSSGGAMCLDFDLKNGSEDDWQVFLEMVGLQAESLLDKCYIERTPSGGYHVIYRSSAPRAKQVLAYNTDKQGLVEHLGVGNYVAVSPSPNYVVVSGSLASLPILSEYEEAVLTYSAQVLHKPTAVEDAPIVRAIVANDDAYTSHDSPFADFNARGDIAPYLESAGWTRTRMNSDGSEYWKHPTATHEVSATYNYGGRKLLHVFSPNTPLKVGSTRHVGVVGELCFGGDYRALRTHLIEAGFGKAINTNEGYQGLSPDTVKDYAIQQQIGLADLALLLIGGERQPAGTRMGRAIYDGNQWWWFGDIDSPLIFQDSAKNIWHSDERGDMCRFIVESICVNALKIALYHYNNLYLELANKYAASGDEDTRKESNEAETTAKNLRKLLMKLLSADTYLSGIMAKLRSRITMRVAWDASPTLLQVANGVLDMTREDDVRLPRPEDYITKRCNVEYDHSANCPTWLFALSQIFYDEPSRIDYLQQLLGYCLTGDVSNHAIIIFYGEKGRNGKDTILNVMHDLLGRYCVKADKSLFTAMHKPVNTASPQVYQIRGARLAYVSETDERDKLSVGQIKDVTGSQTITCRPLYGSFVEFNNTAKFILVTNHLPDAPASDEALWSRIHVVRFTQRFVQNPQKSNERQADTRLALKLQREQAGILNWLLVGARKALQQGLAANRDVMTAAEEYRASVDSVGAFITDCCAMDANARIQAQELYTAYKSYCIDSGFVILTTREFARQLCDVPGIARKKASQIIYTGVELQATLKTIF